MRAAAKMAAAEITMSKKPKAEKKVVDMSGPDRLRKPEVQKAILDRVLKAHPTLTEREALEYLKEAGL
jgi:hypothetical protein